MQLVNNFKKIIIIFVLALVSTSAFANLNNKENFIIKKALEDKIYNDPIWKSLLHIRNNKSIIDDENFFFSKNRKNDAKDELIGTIKAFFSNKDLGDKHAICLFPARFNFLVNKLNLDKNDFPNVKCPQLDQHIRKISPNKISISFASENIASPMSMMGHMFIKVSGENNIKDTEHALSYYADFDGGSSTVFYLKALFSGTKGLYILTPYRNKLIEYNDQNNRNVWNYDLNLTKEQVLQFIYHMWEIKDINVPYNFIIHNCGTATIYMLASADERFYEFIKKPWMSPLDAIKKMYGLGLISNISLFPADSYKIKMYQDNFSLSQEIDIKSFILNEESLNIEIKNPQEQANMLFMAEMTNGYYFLNKKINLEKYSKIQNYISNKFDKLPEVNLIQKTKIPMNAAFSSRINLSIGKYKDKSTINLSFHPVYRSIDDDNSQSFNEFQLELLKMEAFYDLNNDKFHFKKIDLIDVKSFSPTTYLLPTISASFRIGFENANNLYKNKLHTILEGGIGQTIEPINNFKLYAMVYGGMFEKLYIAPEIGLFFNIGSRSKTILSFRKYIKEDKYIDSEITASQNFYLNDRLSGYFDYKYNYSKDFKSYTDFSFGIRYYF